MYCIRIVIFCLLLQFLQAHKECAQNIQWESLLGELNKMSSKISHECSHHYDKASLCDPQHMLKMELNARMLVEIMEKARALYRGTKMSHKVVVALMQAQSTLTSCVHPSHIVEHGLVTTCFSKLQTFLNNKKSNHQCAWEIVNTQIREILQRLENRTFRRKRSLHSRIADQEH